MLIIVVHNFFLLLVYFGHFLSLILGAFYHLLYTVLFESISKEKEAVFSLPKALNPKLLRVRKPSFELQL